MGGRHAHAAECGSRLDRDNHQDASMEGGMRMPPNGPAMTHHTAPRRIAASMEGGMRMPPNSAPRSVE